jgi:hypothetical protein
MDRQHIRDAQIVERYLQGKLSPAEEQAFEEAYLGDPELLAELEAAERLRDGLQDIHEADLAARPLSRSRWLAASPRFGIAASIIAAAALAASGVLLLQNRTRESDALSPLAAASHVRVLSLVSVRGADNANVITAPAADDWTVLLLDPGFGDYDEYRAVLVRVDATATREILRLDGMLPTYEDQLALGVAGRMLTPGKYEVRLAGGRRDSPAGPAFDELGRTPLTVTPRP